MKAIEEVQVGSIEDLYSSIHPSGKKRSATGKKRRRKLEKVDQDDESYKVKFLISLSAGKTAKPGLCSSTSMQHP